MIISHHFWDFCLSFVFKFLKDFSWVLDSIFLTKFSNQFRFLNNFGVTPRNHFKIEGHRSPQPVIYIFAHFFFQIVIFLIENLSTFFYRIFQSFLFIPYIVTTKKTFILSKISFPSHTSLSYIPHLIQSLYKKKSREEHGLDALFQIKRVAETWKLCNVYVIVSEGGGG